MDFTPDNYPRFAIRLNSGELAHFRVVNTQENAAIYFSTKALANHWLQTTGDKSGAHIVELEFETWWLTLLESPFFPFMAFALDDGPTGMAILEAYHVISSHVELSTDGKELLATEFAEIPDAQRAALYAAIVATAEIHGSGSELKKK